MSDVPTRNQLPEALFQAEKLPTIPAVAVEVLGLCRSEDTTLDDLAEVLSFDAALSSRLLRFANSSLYNLGSEVNTLQRATLVLGMKSVQLMSLTFSLASSLPREGVEGFDIAEYWNRSVIRATAGRALAGVAGTMTEDEAFLCGLLAEVGQVVLAECMPEDYKEVVLRTPEGTWPTPAQELGVFGFDSTDVCAALVREWKFPPLICDVLGGMGASDSSVGSPNPNVASTMRVIHLANYVTDVLTGNSAASSLTSLEEQAEELFGITPVMIGALIESLGPAVRESSEMLNVSIPTDQTPAELLAEARGQHLLHTLGTVPKSDTADTLRSTRERLKSDGARTDESTGIGNEGAYDFLMRAELGARLSGHTERPLGLLCLSVDQFASATRVGDPEEAATLMRVVGSAISKLLRASDYAATLEAGQLVVIVGEASPLGLRTLAERIRRGVEAKSSSQDAAPITATVTIGGVCLGYVNTLADGTALLKAAQHYLARAQARGTNHASIYGALLGSKS